MKTFIIEFKSESCDKYMFQYKAKKKPTHDEVGKLLMKELPGETTPADIEYDEPAYLGGEWDVYDMDTIPEIRQGASND